MFSALSECPGHALGRNAVRAGPIPLPMHPSGCGTFIRRRALRLACMKLLAIGILALALVTALPADVVVGEAAATQCYEIFTDDFPVETCDPSCKLGQKFGWECIQ